MRDHNNSMAALQSLGFTPTAAAVLTNWIDSTASMSHKDLLYWVIYHIKSLSDVIIMQSYIITVHTITCKYQADMFHGVLVQY